MNDRTGTYRAIINYVRPGWAFVNVYDPVVSRPWMYKELTKNWLRDLPSAVGLVIVLLGFVKVSTTFLYDDSRLELVRK